MELVFERFYELVRNFAAQLNLIAMPQGVVAGANVITVEENSQAAALICDIKFAVFIEERDMARIATSSSSWCFN